MIDSGWLPGVGARLAALRSRAKLAVKQSKAASMRRRGRGGEQLYSLLFNTEAQTLCRPRVN